MNCFVAVDFPEPILFNLHWAGAAYFMSFMYNIYHNFTLKSHDIVKLDDVVLSMLLCRCVTFSSDYIMLISS